MTKFNLKLWRDIRQQKWQFTALVVVILLGVLSYGGMMGMIDDVEASLDRTLDELRFQDFVVTLEGTATESVVQDVAGVDNVQAVTGRLVMDTGLDISEDNQARARLVGMPTTAQPPVNKLYLQEGRYLQDGDGLVAVVDHHLAEYYGYGPGTVLHPIVNGERLDVEIVGLAEKSTSTVCTGVEMFHKILDEGQAGDNLGLLLRGIDREEVERGMVIAKPGSITPHTKFLGEVYVLKRDEGGRHKAFFSGYRPQFFVRTMDVTGTIQLPEGVEMVMPGDNVNLEVELIVPVALEQGSKFAIREGGLTVGAGVITKIIQ